MWRWQEQAADCIGCRRNRGKVGGGGGGGGEGGGVGGGWEGGAGGGAGGGVGGGVGWGGVAADQRPQRSCSRAHCSSTADCRTTFIPAQLEITIDARIYKKNFLPFGWRLKNLQWSFLLPILKKSNLFYFLVIEPFHFNALLTPYYRHGICQMFYTSKIPKKINFTQEKSVNGDIFGNN